MPQDDLVRIITIDSNYFSLPENPDANRHTQYYMDYGDNMPTRREILNYQNNVHEDIVDSIYSMLDIYVMPNVEVNMVNNTWRNVSGIYGGAYIYNSGPVVITDNIYTDSSNFGFALVSFEEVNGVTIQNFTVDNLDSTGTSDEYFFYLYVNEGYGVSIDNLVVTNTQINYQSVLFVDEFIDYIEISNSEITNCQVSPGVSAYDLGAFYHSEIANITFTNVTSTDEASDSYIISIAGISLDTDTNSSISEVTVTESNIALLQLGSVSEETSQYVSLTLSNIAYTDSQFEVSTSLIDLQAGETDQDFTILGENIMFENLGFTLGGNLINFQSQMANQAVLSNVAISNITNGNIYVDAFNPQNRDLPSKLRFSNMTVDQVNVQYSSLILVNEGAELEIWESLFENIYCYEEGAIIFAGFQASQTSIHGSTFNSNTAIQGALFNIENESVIRMYD